ncbi:predicted protein [Chaetomium globosum CBS 148.51]|uniref:Uncharacterized protein n=1 Tax=Chaetomium globosum (strain ATCC 6205 / CBS 148.51 / DSM 1962 / NBRC 6347 / NRRL 1970) TaxID=306901 RepID=Q2H4S5_CHAGB|nr:uncharacterized protein CHGG_06340 [Chaetomium globosum CBS 148.51]EAQ89721.1 predicted protein [Chaetomium globosum CBS 148.51]
MFNNLPVEILFTICEHIGHSHPSSVLSFALTNKRNYSIACAILYRTIVVEACHSEQLALDTQRCEDLLRRDSAFPHVRRFIVYGGFWKPSYDNHSLERKPMPFKKLFGSPYDDDEDDDQGIIVSFVEGLTFERTPGLNIGQLDACWESLCRLVKLLSGLADFVFALPDLMPPCLLETLHNQFPAPSLTRLRLHVFGFALSSLADGKPDPHELSLASSPLLHRIWVHYCDTDGYDRDGRPSYHGAVVAELAEGFSPNLKDVRLFQDWGDPKDPDGRILPPPPARKRFSKDPPAIGSLRCLEVAGIQMYHDYRGLPEAALRCWRTSTDFSVLQTLNLRQRLDRGGLAFLEEWCSFPNLTTLTLHYDTRAGAGRADAETLHNFLCALPNLRSLELQGSCTLHLKATAFNPGLRRLGLPNQPAELDYERGPEEVKLYRVLGTLPRLRRLSLALDASSPTAEIRYFIPKRAESLVLQGNAHLSTDSTSTIRYAPTRAVFNAFVDSAVDAKLARAIFTAVSQGKKNPVATITNNTAVLPLESLTVSRRPRRRLGGYASCLSGAYDARRAESVT